MEIIAGIQNLIFLALTVVAFVVQLWAFIDCLRFKDENYRAVDKQSKKFWVILLGIGLALAIIALPPMGMRVIFLNIIALVAGIVYLTDVRPKVRAVDPRYRKR
jgi:4-amino-4-deoxy-L-arabinose transferase-like glycosyltransferase